VSQENVAVGRRMIEDFNERTSWWDALDENIEWHSRSDEPDAGVHQGHQAVRRYIGGWEDMFPGYQIELTGPIVDLGEHVVLPAQLVGAARTTGIPVREPYVFLLTLSDGLITRTREFGRQGEALKAVGSEG
jgi:ketosteroid isomerase-like protein